MYSPRIEVTALDDPAPRYVVGWGSSDCPSGVLQSVGPISEVEKVITRDLFEAMHGARVKGANGRTLRESTEDSPSLAMARFERIVETRLDDRPRWPIYLPALLVTAGACASFALLVAVSSLLKGSP